jgi:hypothetical protein
MSSAKKKSTTDSAPNFSKLGSFFAGRGKYLLLFVLLVGVLAATGYEIVQFVRGRVLTSEEYRLTAEKIRLSPWPMPIYVQPDPRIWAITQLQRRGPVSIVDEDLVERVTAAFEQNPWVAKVHKVKKFPAEVDVELEYRRPVMMVAVDAEANAPYSLGYAVDAEGISLPTRNCFTSQETAKYPRLVGVEKPPVTGEGKRWGDSRVIGGAEIAAELLPIWEKLHLKRIVPLAISPRTAGPSASATQSPQFGEYHFEIIGPGDKRILWGKSPYDKSTQNPTPAQKAKKLEALFSEWGGLENCSQSVIDLNKP